MFLYLFIFLIFYSFFNKPKYDKKKQSHHIEVLDKANQ